MSMAHWLFGLTEKDKLKIEAERAQHIAAQAIADRDAKDKELEEATRDLDDAKLRNSHLLDEFDRLAAMFRGKIADLGAAEQLLSEAGARIDRLSESLVGIAKERDAHLNQLREIAAITRQPSGNSG